MSHQTDVVSLRAQYLTQRLSQETIRASAVLPKETLARLQELTKVNCKNELIGIALANLLNNLEVGHE